MRSLCFFLLAFLSMGAFAPEAKESLEVFNQHQNFDQVPKCGAHSEFLEGKDIVKPINCNSIAVFQIENSDLPTSEYLTKLYIFAGKETALGAAALAARTILYTNPITAFSSAELASRRITITLSESGDVERAVLYSHLFFEVKREILQSLCREDAMCDEISVFQGLGDSFGSQFKYIDNEKPISVLVCLLKMDSYLEPVRNILRSPRFKHCLVAHKLLGEGDEQ
ncbi:hypothetical protein PsAD5_02345 [Pseudovibrio sp. Ad5]|uniref:hypothetical protein n=1 Tax=Pseudovibrio sp. Ad5 TaxID=989436 RepID=UPI0007AEB1F8|nr:hypothetical protein [Pseudovibrio sp. Ad5]KZK97216.1 hypothetical protein PsAD5_02345 [Pseudovibrio sp. Ad5]